jgi:hypothetical protein
MRYLVSINFKSSNFGSGRYFPLESIALHSTICARHNTLCDRCNAVVKKTEMEAHLQSVHAAVFYYSSLLIS